MRRDRVGRGCETNTLHYNRELGFFAIALREFSSFAPDWHQDDRAHPLVRQYLTALDAALEPHPHLARCVTKCVHCQIRFLTDPRNAGRQNLRCPFGCREHHARQKSNERVRAYYGTEAGKKKKAALNGKRARHSTSNDGPRQAESIPASNTVAQPLPSDPPGSELPTRDVTLPDEPDSQQPLDDPGSRHPAQEPASPQRPDEPGGNEPFGELPVRAELQLGDLVLDEPAVANSPMLPYLRMLIRLIEGFRLTEHQIVAMLQRAMRQRSMARMTKAEYILAFLHKHPPWDDLDD